MLVSLHSPFIQMKINMILLNQGGLYSVCKHSTNSLTFIRAAIFTLKCGMHSLTFRRPAGTAGEVLIVKPCAVP